MSDTSSACPPAGTVLGDLTMAQLRATVCWAAGSRELAPVCERWLRSAGDGVREGARRVRPGDLAALPQMTREQAMEAARHRLRGRPGHYLVSSGTTGVRAVRALTGRDAFTPGSLGDWRPLRPGDVLLNCLPAGGAYLHTERLADLCGVHTVTAPTDLTALARIAGELREIGVNAVAGLPHTLAVLAEDLLAHGNPLPLRTVLWTGEHLSPGCRAALRELNPRVELWGTYSASETGAVAAAFPGCPPGVLHLWPGQVLELSARGCLLTRAAAPGAARPLLRTALDDRLAAARCTCSRVWPAVRVLGRAGHTVRLRGAELPVDGLRLAAADSAEVTGAQLLAVPADPARPHGPLSRLGLRVQPRPGGAAGPGGAEARAAARVLARHPRLRAVAARHPDAFFAEAAPLALLSYGKVRPVVVVAGAAG
ncbi:AMP-binding protein [Streptomyces sp. NPDC052020]|uniref:AMP-binding protein n=1 Tax=Streptomyces sp. NPDC052020 TaxID=3155677 RepID=UPI003416A707